MAAISANAPLASFPRRGWIQSPGWDLFWMFSALWGGTLLLGTRALPALAGIGVSLFVADRLLSVSHSWSTTYMVLFSPLLRDERRAHPLRYRGIPAFIALFSLGLGLYVAGWQRYPADGRWQQDLWAFALYVSLFWVLHFWHFGNQDFGVLTIYRSKAGQERWLDRRVDKLYTAAMMFLIQPVVYLSLVRTTAFSELVHTLIPVPRAALEGAALGAVVLAGGLALGFAGFELAKPNRSLPKVLYGLVIWLHPTLIYASVHVGNESLALFYVMAYLWSHWFIAIGLVGRINSRYHRSRGDGPAVALLRHVAILGAIIGVALIVTQDFQEYALFNVDGFAYKSLLAGIEPGQTLLIGGVLGFFLGEQLLHYYCDRRLFRFRDPAVRRAVGPLLLGS